MAKKRSSEHKKSVDDDFSDMLIRKTDVVEIEKEEIATGSDWTKRFTDTVVDATETATLNPLPKLVYRGTEQLTSKPRVLFGSNDYLGVLDNGIRVRRLSDDKTVYDEERGYRRALIREKSCYAMQNYAIYHIDLESGTKEKLKINARHEDNQFTDMALYENLLCLGLKNGLCVVDLEVGSIVRRHSISETTACVSIDDTGAYCGTECGRVYRFYNEKIQSVDEGKGSSVACLRVMESLLVVGYSNGMVAMYSVENDLRKIGGINSIRERITDMAKVGRVLCVCSRNAENGIRFMDLVTLRSMNYTLKKGFIRCVTVVNNELLLGTSRKYLVKYGLE